MARNEAPKWRPARKTVWDGAAQRRMRRSASALAGVESYLTREAQKLADEDYLSAGNMALNDALAIVRMAYNAIHAENAEAQERMRRASIGFK